MMQWLRKRSLPERVLVYVAAAILAFALAAGAGVMGALILQDDLNVPGRVASRSPDEQKNAARPQQKDAAEEEGAAKQKDAVEQKDATPQQKDTTPQQSEAEYVSKVGDIQNDSVETFLESNERILVYDALTTDDIEQMRANDAALQGFVNQANGLDPPQKYGEHYEVFSSAINELHEATQLAYNMAADPTAVTQTDFDEYDRRVNEASALLKRSNELLGKDYKTIEGVRQANPLS